MDGQTGGGGISISPVPGLRRHGRSKCAYECKHKIMRIKGNQYKTRLLGRPQPQMYPPVALNQYTLVNRTHKHYIYICFKAPQTS